MGQSVQPLLVVSNRLSLFGEIMKTIDKTIILARVSSKEQEETGYSIPAQIKFLQNYCTQHNMYIAKTFSFAESASASKHRDEFVSMLEYVNTHKITHIVIEKVDRLTRNLKDAVIINDWLEENEDRKVHFVKDSLVIHKFSRSQEKLNWDIRLVFAKNYIDNLKEEVLKGMKEKLEQGWMPASPPPGYITTGNSGHKTHVVDKPSSVLVKKMFEMYSFEDYSVTSITIKMAEIGLVNKRNKPYSRSQIHNLLSNPFYIGINRWGGKEYTGKQDVFIDSATFQAVQEKLNRKGSSKYRKHNPLFKGMMICANCGCRITWEIQKGHWYGHCTGYKGCIDRRFVRQENIESEITNQFLSFKSPTNGLVECIEQSYNMSRKTHIELSATKNLKLNERVKKLNRRLDILYEDRLDERITVERYDNSIKSIKQEIEEAQKLIEISDDDTTLDSRVLKLFNISQNLPTIYQRKSDDEKRKIISLFFSNLKLNRDILDYELTTIGQIFCNGVKKEKQLIDTFERTKKASAKDKETSLVLINKFWLRRLDSNQRPID